MIVFVTGATAGFGAAIARRFARAGHTVVASGRRRERLDALVDELGDAVVPFVLDVTDRAATDALPGSLPPAVADDRRARQQRRARARPRAGAPRRPRRLGDDDRHERQGPDADDARAAARHGRARPRPRRQHRLGRRPLRLSRRQRLRRDEGVRRTTSATTCAPTCSARRSASRTSSPGSSAAPSSRTSASRATTIARRRCTTVPRR